jgi:DNA-binding HxlR family transcriptional regulator
VTRAPIERSNAIAIEGLLTAVRQGADVICDRWSLKLIIAALLGDRRFSDFRQRTGLASRLATMRLRSLVDQGILVQLPYSIRPLRHEYHLTNMGRGFLPVIVQMIRWEQTWNRNTGDAARDLATRLGLGVVAAELRCKACGEVAGAHDIRLKIIPSQLQQKPPKQALHRRSTISSADAADEMGMLGESLDLFGNKWGVELLVCAFTRIRRFNDFRSSTGISANILSDRLGRMTEAGILRRAEEGEGQAEPGYRLTAKGLASYGVLVALQDWSDAWLSQRYRSPVQLIHKSCGRPFHALNRDSPR